MTEPALSEESDLLARARRSLSPAAADAERVRRALVASLAAGPAGPVAPARRAATPAPSSPWIPRLIVHGLVAALAGATGYWIGQDSMSHERTPRLHQATPSSPPSSATPSPSVSAGPPSAPSSPPSDSLPPPYVQSPRPRHTPAAATARPGAAPATAPAAAAPTPAESLAKEVRALRSVERALRDSQPGLALALLAQLDREVPDGKLVEEREATATIARCASGSFPFGVDLGDAFADRYRDSVYLARVRQACGGP